MEASTLKILTWNIGVFQPLTYLKVFGKRFNSNFIEHEFFHRENGVFISEHIKETSPDLIILQEIFSFDDIESIPGLKEYPHIKLIETWGHNNICIASKKPFALKNTGNMFQIIEYEGFHIIPLHLNSFSAKKRFKEIDQLCEVLKNIPDQKDIVLIGDTNLWERKKRFLFSQDKKSYLLLTSLIREVDSEIIATHRFGAYIDKVFCSDNIKIKKVDCYRKSRYFMDHYPLHVEITK